MPGGEITPEKLIVLGEVAKKYGLYTKITGGQRVDLFGAPVHQLPDIWEELVDAGFESGHAYGKALRTVKSCVGSTWCRYGVQDSVGFAIRVENRYKGLRAPHKLKAAVSGCVRECAEAQSKDFGLIATEKGYNLYVCGNGGAKPRHADLLAADLDEETCIRYIDRFLMYYIQTADRLTRTSVWLEKMEGGIEYLRDVIVNDRLGIAAELERQMQFLVDTYQCEWAEVVDDPEKRRLFQQFANTDETEPTIEFVNERGQQRPGRLAGAFRAARASSSQGRAHESANGAASEPAERWVPGRQGVGLPARRRRDDQVRQDADRRVQLRQPRRVVRRRRTCARTSSEFVLSRGMLGDQNGTPKVACPLHKKTFSLESGACLSGEDYSGARLPGQGRGGRRLRGAARRWTNWTRCWRREKTCNGSCHEVENKPKRKWTHRKAKVPDLLPADPNAEKF